MREFESWGLSSKLLRQDEGRGFLVGLHKEDGGNVSLPDEQTPERDHPRSPGDGKSPEVACLERRLTRGEGSPSGNTFIAARKALRVPPVACTLARGNGFVLECAQMAVAPQVGWRCKHSTNGGEGHQSVKLLVVETWAGVQGQGCLGVLLFGQFSTMVW